MVGFQALQAHESYVPSRSPAGTVGVAGDPEQKAPEQGRWGVGWSSDWLARSRLSRSIKGGSRVGSFREVTR
jgi:hypothetical protein